MWEPLCENIFDPLVRTVEYPIDVQTCSKNILNQEISATLWLFFDRKVATLLCLIDIPPC